jgi:hypothetical protein
VSVWLDVETWQLDALLFGSTVDGAEYVVNEVTGWSSSAAPRTARIPRPAAHGSYRSPNWKGDKIVTLAGYVAVDDKVMALAVERRLERLCGDPQVLYSLRHVDSLSGEDLTLWVELDAAILINTRFDLSPLQVDFSLQLAASDPRKYTSTASTASTGLATPADGGVAWDGTAGGTGTEWNGPAGTTGLEYQTTGGTLGTVDLVNAGTESTSVKFTITGNVANPLVRNLTTGEVIAYGGTLVAADVLVIDTGTGAVTLNGANRRPQLTRADFFQLPPGTTRIQFEGTAVSGSPQLFAEWYSAY